MWRHVWSFTYPCWSLLQFLNFLSPLNIILLVLDLGFLSTSFRICRYLQNDLLNFLISWHQIYVLTWKVLRSSKCCVYSPWTRNIFSPILSSISLISCILFLTYIICMRLTIYLNISLKGVHINESSWNGALDFKFGFSQLTFDNEKLLK